MKFTAKLERILSTLPEADRKRLLDHLLGVEPWPGSVWIGPIFWPVDE